MNRYWFKPKRYGYGATPVTWEGWAVTGAAILIVLIASLLLPSDRATVAPAGWIAFTTIVVLTVVVFWIVSARKTDGARRWRWGNDHD